MGQLGTSRRTGTRTGGDGRTPTSGGTSGGTGGSTGSGKPLIAGGYPDDGARHMPIYGEDARVAKQLRDALVSRSGRRSTDLTGTRTYVSSFLGSTN